MECYRFIRHLTMPGWWPRRVFSPVVLDTIEKAIRESECLHRGEIRLVVEGGLDFIELCQGMSVRDRAIEVFSRLRVWDTEENSGVLIYVQWVDRRVEIVADRGIVARVPQVQWDALCRALEAAFRERRYAEGCCDAVRSVGALLAAHFPAGRDNPNELPDRPVVL